MAALTSMQRHVLANLDRVVDFPYKLNKPQSLRRYQLDGKECSMQITGLVVRGCVREAAGGKLIKLLDSRSDIGRDISSILLHS